MALAVLLAWQLALFTVGLAAVGGARRTHLSGRYRVLLVVALTTAAFAAIAASVFDLALAVGIFGLSLAGLVGLGLDKSSGRAAGRLVTRYLAVAATLVGVGVLAVQAGDSLAIDGLIDRMGGAPTPSGAPVALLLLALAALAGLTPLGAAALVACRRSTPHTAILLLSFAPAVALTVLWRVTSEVPIARVFGGSGAADAVGGALATQLAIPLGVAGALTIASGASLLRRPRDHRLWIAGLASTLVGQAILGVALGAGSAIGGALIALLVAVPLALLAPTVAGAAGDATLVELAALARRRPLEASLFVVGVAVGLGLLPAFGFAGRVSLVAAGIGAGPSGIAVVLVALVGWAFAAAAAVAALARAANTTASSRRPMATTGTLGRASIVALAAGAFALAIAWPTIATTSGSDPAATALVAAALASGVVLGIRRRRQANNAAVSASASLVARLDKRLGLPGTRLAQRIRRVDWIDTDALTLVGLIFTPFGRAAAWLLDATFGRLARS